ncbi:ThuA domain-containing protein [Lentisphaera profundi]|uniref:ThuA domain-containing protein n=1 Tax=Lentisphaera profundi TaxID=1658616 RepID=A0ABY7VZN0_9BACT|nr:ThuA domain-containing protein [Lentisphaera profundi]WDE98744.1 ThuA domain-containing protein [Lentisphaera profundi]
MKKFILLTLALMSISTLADAKKILYVTHEPGKYHKYTPQKEAFIKMAKEAGWELTVSTGMHEPQIVALRDPKLTEGYDAVVYNFCFASSKDLKAVSNVIAQTREKGTPAMVIHCSMHSFWATFKGKNGKVTIKDGLKEQWDKENPGKAFPVWGDFTGVASTGHGPKAPITIEKCCEHEATQSLKKEGYTTAKVSELYNNYYVTKDVKPLLNGTQKGKKGKTAKAIVMWEVPQGKSKVIGLSLGHDMGEWSQPEFQGLVKDAVNYLAK